MRAAKKRIHLGERRKGGFFSSRKPPELNTLSGGLCPSKRT
jgi:hypothetical protein